MKYNDNKAPQLLPSGPRKHMLVLFTYIISVTAYGQGNTFYNQNGLAIKGYDPVAYFLEQKAVEGSSLHQLPWNGVTWQFKNETNLQLFKGDPEKYAPQYGGWCAYGVSENHKSPTDPFAWTIANDKLYLNYNTKVKEKWSSSREENIQQADIHWKVLKNN